MSNGNRYLLLGHETGNHDSSKYSGGMFKLNKGDKLHVQVIVSNGATVKTAMWPAHSFFGASKVDEY